MNAVFASHPTRSATPGRPVAYAPRTAGPQHTRVNLQDDYERWYTEPTHNNRMVLALCSGIDSEIAWALDRLCRLCNNERFVLKEIPGLTEALFEWPFWYVKDGASEIGGRSQVFSLRREEERWIRHALESMFILRNSAQNAPNSQELVGRRATQELILLALHRLDPDIDHHAEFLLNTVDLLQTIAGGSVLPPPDSFEYATPVPPLLNLVRTSTDRALIISALATLNQLFANPPNMAHLTTDSPALAATIRYLPLFKDDGLMDACLNFLYTHLSYMPMSKAFLLHENLSSTLRVLVSYLLSKQVEEPVSVALPGGVFTAPAEVEPTTDHELTQDELEYLLPLPEPQRCFEWMKIMFELDPESEVTQVDFWTSYRDVFAAYSLALGASDVIKNVSLLWPQAVAMVLPGPPQKFVVRGVTRKKNKRSDSEIYQCRWNRGECGEAKFTSSGELFEHILEQHINPHTEPEIHCSWATCAHRPLSKALVRGHVLTHIPSMQPPPKHPMQDDRVTLPYQGFPHPVPEPTKRPVPPPRFATINYRQPTEDPPSSALTALLCIRILFRTAFASSDAAPHFDEDHFGFPGVVDDDEEKDKEDSALRDSVSDSEREGERRGRKAFVGVRYLLEGVRLRDEVLNGWITEMVDAGLTGAS